MAKTSGNDSRYILDSIVNVKTNEITISEDKLRNKLGKHIQAIKKSANVLAYLGLAITCLSVVVSASFKEWKGITPDMWKMLFIIGTIVFGFLFVNSAIYALFHKTSVDAILVDIKTIETNDIPSKNSWLSRIIAQFGSDKKSESEEEKNEDNH